jgi:hypothetical protein
MPFWGLAQLWPADSEMEWLPQPSRFSKAGHHGSRMGAGPSFPASELRLPHPSRVRCERLENGAGGPVFELADTSTAAGAPLLRFCKGGNRECMQRLFLRWA